MQGLAYEIVINSNPCIAYLMEENTMTMQALVIAHACYGHNSFFKGNYLFRQWTNADAILDYLVFARRYVMECEERHGAAAVEEVLDACHALMRHGVDRYRRPRRCRRSRRDGAPAASARRTASGSSTTCGARVPSSAAAREGARATAASRRSRRRTSSISSRSTRRSSSPGSASSCASCASWRSTSIRRARPR